MSQYTFSRRCRQSRRFISSVAALFLFSPVSANANGFTTSIYGGYNHLSTTQKLLELPAETDTIQDIGGTDSFVGGIGAGYRFDTNALGSYLKAITIGPDLFLFKTTLTGKVWQFQNPAFDNFNHSLQVKTVRLMLDGWLDIPPLLFGINPFAGGGIGIANVKTQYHDSVSVSGYQSGLTGGDINLSTKTNRKFVYSLGAGLKKELFPQLQLSGFYLFTDFGRVQTSTQAAQVTLEQPMSFQMKTHSVLLALTYFFG